MLIFTPPMLAGRWVLGRVLGWVLALSHSAAFPALYDGGQFYDVDNYTCE